jgi:hypothetical protein
LIGSARHYAQGTKFTENKIQEKTHDIEMSRDLSLSSPISEEMAYGETRNIQGAQGKSKPRMK